MNKQLFFAAVGVLLLILSGCKYEDGPAFSLASKKSRVANTWKLEKIYNDGVEQTIDELGFHSLELTKDGQAIFTLLEINTIAPLQGTWKFGDGKETLEIIYTDGSGGPDDVPAVYTILRLKQKELWLERSYDDGNQVYTVETHYVPM